MLITLFRSGESEFIQRNPKIFAILSWVLVCVTVRCGTVIISCGITGVSQDGTTPSTMRLAGLLLLTWGLVCGDTGRKPDFMYRYETRSR